MVFWYLFLKQNSHVVCAWRTIARNIDLEMSFLFAA